ncbi:MAG: hypothetical protein KKC51_03715 [Verrucomicrobia bacterium]|nr:hypothetical protein [Verrucomicrobiota bacterium]
MMRSIHIPATIEEFALPPSTVMDATVVVPTVRGRWKLKYGEHAYYFMNFRASKGFSVSIRHLDIIQPGFERFKRAGSTPGRPPSTLRCFFRSYHYGFSFLEQIMLMTVPHTATDIGEGRYIINLWSYCGFLLVDCRAKRATYHILEDAEADHVLGSEQWFDPDTHELYAMSYSLRDSFERLRDATRPISSRIFKHRIGSDATEEIWSGSMADSLHEIVVSADRRYCVACELGMYLDAENNIIPSKVLIVELDPGRRQQWTLDCFIVAAHAQFDPEDPNVIYFSNHNFQFEHSSLFKLLKQGAYAVRFRGPAAIFKYRLTLEGPREIGVFTRPDFYRLTNMHIFMHRGRKVIAAMGFPDEVFLIDAEEMSYIRKIKVNDPVHWTRADSGKTTVIGTIAPSPDGTKLFVQTTMSFQVVDLASGQPDYVRDCGRHHTCANHMVASPDTSWECPERRG